MRLYYRDYREYCEFTLITDSTHSHKSSVIEVEKILDNIRELTDFLVDFGKFDPNSPADKMILFFGARTFYNDQLTDYGNGTQYQCFVVRIKTGSWKELAMLLKLTFC